MSWHELELMARGGTLALLVLWSWLLWRDDRAELAARVAIAMNLSIACYVTVTAGWGESMSLLGLVLALGAGATPGLFWLFSKTWFGDRTRIEPGDLLLVVLSVINVLVMQVSIGSGTAVPVISGILFRIALFGFAGAGLWHAWRGREGDLIEGRRRLRFGIVVTVGVYVLAIGVAEPAVFQGGASRAIISVIGSSIVFITLALCAAMFASRQRDLFGSPSRPDPRPQPADDNPLAERLRGFMETEKPHRDEGLTIAALAARLGEQEYRLRRLINGSLGHRNFAQFLNGYRLAEVKAALADPTQREVPILTIALDAGFGSLGPFNRAFRDAEGMTPSEFRSKALVDSGIG